MTFFYLYTWVKYKYLHYYCSVSVKANDWGFIYAVLSVKYCPLKQFFIFKIRRIFNIQSGTTKDKICEYKTNLKTENIISKPRPFNEAFQKSFTYIAPKLFICLKQYKDFEVCEAIPAAIERFTVWKNWY